MTNMVVLGGAGGVGGLFCRALLRDGHVVTAVDRRACAPPLMSMRADAAAPNRVLADALAGADCVLFCLPEDVALASVGPVSAAMRPGALIVDTLSVKSRFAAVASSVAAAMETLGVNPLFAPEIGFDGQNVAVVRSGAGPRGDSFVAMLKAWCANVTEMSAEEHDRAMAMIQALTHATVLGFGCALRDMGYSATGAAGLRTPFHNALLALLARILEGAPSVYRDIQLSNPHSAPARSALTAAHLRLEAALNADAPDERHFESMLGDLHALLGPAERPLAEQASRMLKALPR